MMRVVTPAGIVALAEKWPTEGGRSGTTKLGKPAIVDAKASTLVKQLA